MEELKLITTIHYLTGKLNEEFWALLETLRKDGKLINSDWNGDYYGAHNLIIKALQDTFGIKFKEII